VERKVEGFAVRQLVLAAEPVADKVWRVVRLVSRAIPMLALVSRALCYSTPPLPFHPQLFFFFLNPLLLCDY
jgi:hypothetical protein